MPLPSDLVGRSGEAITQRVDARWTMAYAAALGHDEPVWLDTSARSDVLAHPLFPVCYEWPVFLDPRHLPSAGALSSDERLRGVHATHDVVLHRPIRAGCEVSTRASVVQVEARRPGAYQLTRLDSVDESGRPLSTTWYGTIYRGVEVQGDDRCQDDAMPPPLDAQEPGSFAEQPLPVAANAAHVYTECARIWNPIHTDRAVARAAGLPDIILHGTATLALAVSALLRDELRGKEDLVARVVGRFAAMVRMPSTCIVRNAEVTSPQLRRFEVLNEEGETALRDAGLVLRS